MRQEKIGDRVYPLDRGRVIPTQCFTNLFYSIGFSKTGFGDSAEEIPRALEKLRNSTGI